MLVDARSAKYCLGQGRAEDQPSRSRSTGMREWLDSYDWWEYVGCHRRQREIEERQRAICSSRKLAAGKVVVALYRYGSIHNGCHMHPRGRLVRQPDQVIL